MLYGIIADIHSNLEAFRVVLQELRAVEQIVCLGDIVGYGPNPTECITIMKERNIPTVAGNHDKAAVGEMSTQWFNENARLAVEWTSEQLTDDSIVYLKTSPLTLEFDDFQIVHGSLVNPLEEYLENRTVAFPTFEKMTKGLLFVGHTHVPLHLRSEAKEIINPGSVGQPRDGDPRASFGIYDSEKKEFTLHRIEYNISLVQEKMKKAELPPHLIERLSYGQ